jgi:lipopolysaccharide transport system permease protein
MDETRVYTPDSPIRHPRLLLASMARDARSARVLAWRLLRRDLAAQYRQTAFGYVWAVLPAVLLTLVWVAVNSSGFVNIETSIPYPVYVLTGTIFWQLFLDALNAPLKQLNQNKQMLNRVSFPTEALIASGMAQVLFGFAIKLVVLAGTMAVYTVHVRWTAILAVFPALGLLAIGTVAGVLLAPLGLLYKDVEQVLIAIVSPLLFLTPVLYPPPSDGVIGKIVDLNPLTPIFSVLRDTIFGGGGTYLPFVAVFLVTLLLGSVAWVMYRLSLPILIERMEA